MNKYRGWTITYYAERGPERCYSAEQFDRKSGTTILLHAPSRVAVERAVDTHVQTNKPEEIELGI